MRSGPPLPPRERTCAKTAGGGRTRELDPKIHSSEEWCAWAPAGSPCPARDNRAPGANTRHSLGGSPYDAGVRVQLMTTPTVATRSHGRRHQRCSERQQITRPNTLPHPRSVLQRIGQDSPKSTALSTELRAHIRAQREHETRFGILSTALTGRNSRPRREVHRNRRRLAAKVG